MAVVTLNICFRCWPTKSGVGHDNGALTHTRELMTYLTQSGHLRVVHHRLHSFRSETSRPCSCASSSGDASTGASAGTSRRTSSVTVHCTVSVFA